MFTDMYTIIRKEWKEMFLQRGSGGMRGGLLGQLLILALLGVFVPLQVGSAILTQPTLALVWLWLPVMLTMNMVAESFAGERERHTLETLLASRLSDRAILFAKMAASILYGFSIGLLAMLLAAVTVNIASPAAGGGIQFYPAQNFIWLLVVILLVNALMAALGVLVSLRAKTVRQAYQQLSVGLILLFVVPIFSLQFIPSLRQSLDKAMASMNAQQVGLVVIGVLLVIDAALIGATMARFKRNKLLD
jgi:ABC-2 type transport system permease protein